MIDFNQLINTAIANTIELAVREQLTPYILRIQELEQRFNDFTTNVNSALENNVSTQTISSGFDGIEDKDQLTGFIEGAVLSSCDIEDLIDARIDYKLEQGDYVKTDALEDAINDILDNATISIRL